MSFFTFSKMVKNTPMTRKIHLPKHWHYEFFSFFGFGFKQSIAIFSAIQNVIWSWIDDFRLFWKLRDFLFLTSSFTQFFPVFACKFRKMLVFNCFWVIFFILKSNYFLENSPIYERFLIYIFASILTNLVSTLKGPQWLKCETAIHTCTVLFAFMTSQVFVASYKATTCQCVTLHINTKTGRLYFLCCTCCCNVK